jgi:elongation factor P
MLPLNQVRAGAKIIFRDSPHQVLEANHLKVGRGGAKLTTKLRSLLDGSVIDYTFAGEEKLEEALVSYKGAQYLYSEGTTGFFMLNDTYEQVSLPTRPDQTKFLKEGGSVDLVLWQDQVIDVQVPKKVVLEVQYTEPAAKGNTVNAATKDATLETGATVKVPLFIKTGDLVEVNTETGLYSARA